MYFKIGVLKDFVIFTGKHPCWRLFLIKFKKRLQQRCFPKNIATFFYMNSFFYRTLLVAASVKTIGKMGEVSIEAVVQRFSVKKTFLEIS